MIDFVKKHILLVISIIGTVIILILLLMLYQINQNTSNKNLVDEVLVSELILLDSETSSLEKTAASTALDNIFSFSNYGDTTQFLYGLLQSSTDKFKPRINDLIKTLEQDESNRLFSRLNVTSQDYIVNVQNNSNTTQAVVEFKGKLSTQGITSQSVTVRQKLIYQHPYWYLDEYEIIEE